LKKFFLDFAAKFALINNYTGINMAQVGIKSTTIDGVQATGDLTLYYMPLRDFCRIVNTVLLVDQNNNPIVKINTSI